MEGFKMDQNLYRALNQLLQDLTVAERNVHILHWNLIAEGFIYLHPYLGDVYNQIFEFIIFHYENLLIHTLYKCVKYSSDCVHF